MDYRHIFDESPTFAPLSLLQKDFLFSISEVKQYPSNQQVFTFENRGKYFYMVVDGELSLRLKNNRTKRYKRGDVFGEIAIFTKDQRTGIMRTETPATLLAIDSDRLFFEMADDPVTNIMIIKQLTRQIINYLGDKERHGSFFLITKGENKGVEFKESISKSVRSTMLRTICAFMNSSGGTMFFGVKDDKTIPGLPHMSYEEIDRFGLTLINRINMYVGKYFSNLIQFDAEYIEDKLILRIDVEAAIKPAFINKGEREEFYVRSGASTVHLDKMVDIIEHTRARFAYSQ
jgi:hypothetical protein